MAASWQHGGQGIADLEALKIDHGLCAGSVGRTMEEAEHNGPLAWETPWRIVTHLPKKVTCHKSLKSVTLFV